MDEGYIKNGNLQLHYIAEGANDGEPVLLLHGFPQFSYEWRHQIKALATAGYRAVAPDLRGYNLSDKPEKVEDYAIGQLISDIGAFYQAFGWRKANIIAHDWGGGIAWAFVIYQPQLVSKYIAMDIPHPAAMAKAMQSGVQQLQRSWYMWFFQTPGAAEYAFGGENIDRFIDWVLLGKQEGNGDTITWGSGKHIFSPEDIATYKQMLSQPGQLTAAINYYRANINPAQIIKPRENPFPPVQVPTMLIYGTQDFAFADSVWEDSAQYIAAPFKKVAIEGAGHWTPEEAPAEVNRHILEFLKSN
jgi:pimeloyl-ACP methyl ester carboxylesterase